MTDRLDKARALLLALTAPHDTVNRPDTEHVWRKCRRCLSYDELEDAEASACIRELVAEFDRLRAPK